MFNSEYFAPRYWTKRYFPQGLGVVATAIGAALKFVVRRSRVPRPWR
ncbi:MAG TPA: hypothetical protein VG406_23695 [Isosphaeraceae bacterium]|jgi:hypothetical protein|nr:hypothetical protein [Isosphaeraceae bacterium]